VPYMHTLGDCTARISAISACSVLNTVGRLLGRQSGVIGLLRKRMNEEKVNSSCGLFNRAEIVKVMMINIACIVCCILLT